LVNASNLRRSKQRRLFSSAWLKIWIAYAKSSIKTMRRADTETNLKLFLEQILDWLASLKERPLLSPFYRRQDLSRPAFRNRKTIRQPCKKNLGLVVNESDLPHLQLAVKQKVLRQENAALKVKFEEHD
jgi:hypothetical protein